MSAFAQRRSCGEGPAPIPASGAVPPTCEPLTIEPSPAIRSAMSSSFTLEGQLQGIRVLYDFVTEQEEQHLLTASSGFSGYGQDVLQLLTCPTPSCLLCRRLTGLAGMELEQVDGPH